MTLLLQPPQRRQSTRIVVVTTPPPHPPLTASLATGGGARIGRREPLERGICATRTFLLSRTLYYYWHRVDLARRPTTGGLLRPRRTHRGARETSHTPKAAWLLSTPSQMPSRQERRKAERDAAKRAPAHSGGSRGSCRCRRRRSSERRREREAPRQGLTLVHSALLERILCDRGACRGCLGGV